MRRAFFRLILAAAAPSCLLVLATHQPFGFGSPDGSFHAAKLLRAAHGEPFVDPFSGTPSIYPALFHAAYGLAGRLLGIEGPSLFRLAGLCNFLMLFAGFYALARIALGDGERAALATLAVPLVFYAPSGRHVLLANPANLAIPLLLLGGALLLRSLAGPPLLRSPAGTPLLRSPAGTPLLRSPAGTPLALVAGAFLCGLAANVAWYMALPALALIGARLFAGSRQDLARTSLLCAAAALAPCLFTAWQLWSIREVLPDYADFPAVEMSRQGAGAPSLGLLRDWAVATLTKGNSRFEGLLDRSVAAWVHYYLLVVPVACALIVLGGRRARALAAGGMPAARRLLCVAFLAIFALSLPFAVLRDFPRVVAVQFAGWALLLVLALEAVSPPLKARWRALAEAGLAAAGLFSLAYTVGHTRQPFESRPPRSTAAVVDFIAGLPGHAGERVFVTERHLREIAPFVTFRSFVNHGDGRYYAQDARSAAGLLLAYRSLLERREDWRETLQAYGVRFLAFRHADGGQERDAALFYLQRGRAVLQNAEWWVVEVAARPAGEAQRGAPAQ